MASLFGKKETYTCKYCGIQSSNSNIAGATCIRSPHKKHELMSTTEEQPRYTCKFCGMSSSNSTFAGAYCLKSPHKTHELLG